jgi:hydrogenase nickel incorporation protein HypA/HybF
MRELSLIARLLRRIEQEGRAAGAVRVSAVRLRVGACSGVEPGGLIRAFDRLAWGTLAQGARLEIERVAVVAECHGCGSRFQVECYCFQCPSCGSRRTQVVAGGEVVLESLTIVTECDASLTWVH